MEVGYALDFVPDFMRAATKSDVDMGRTISGYWLDFIKTGDPNSGDRPKWPRYDPTTRDALNFTNTGVTYGPDPVKESFTQMHPPLIHHPEFTGRSGGGVYSDTLAELDHRTGQVLDAIEQAGISENTIVVWSSDNPAGRSTSMGGSNGPWRGHFGSGFEGGMRTPAIVRWPGKVKAGAVSDEILTAVDWLPTLASLVGESQRVPTDRPINGVDASAFLLGHSPTTGRDHVIYYGSDAEVMSVKWRTMKVVFRYSESTSGPIIKPQWPLVFDLIDDPVEEWDLIEKRLDCAWVFAPVAKCLDALQQTVTRYPNIKPGEEFTGYS